MSDVTDHNPGWPPELRAALMEFDAWSKAQLLKVEQTESTPAGPLYHYTGEAGLRGILTRQRLWCFSHLHQKDPTEFEYALMIARRVIKEVGVSDDFFTHHFCACVDDMLETNWLAGPFEFYLFSLGKHRDHAPQWREYGQAGQGYAIGFGSSLFQPEKDDLYDEANKNLHIGRVIYGDEATSARHRLAVAKAAEITSRVGKANVELVRTVKPGHYLSAMTRELLASQMVWNCLTAKHERYADEREVRGIIMNVKSRFDPYRLVHNGRTFIEHEMSLKATGSIAEILVGPLAPEDAEMSVTRLLLDEGYPEIPIRRSTFRSNPGGER
jgi:hypothetical protein